MNEKTTTKTNKQGFVIYRDTLACALEILPKDEDRGKLLTALFNYVSNKKSTFNNDLIFAAYKFLTLGIDNADAKFEKQRARRAAYYQRKKEKQVQLYDKSVQNEKNEKSEKSEELKKNGIEDEKLHKVIYNIEDVKKELFKKNLFFSNDENFNEFYRFNSEEMKWRYKPATAAARWFKIHPAHQAPQIAAQKQQAPQPPAAPKTPPRLQKFFEEFKEQCKNFVTANDIRVWFSQIELTSVKQQAGGKFEATFFCSSKFVGETMRDKFETDIRAKTNVEPLWIFRDNFEIKYIQPRKL